MSRRVWSAKLGVCTYKYHRKQPRLARVKQSTIVNLISAREPGLVPHKADGTYREQAPKDKCQSQQTKGKRNTPKQAEAPARQKTTPTTTNHQREEKHPEPEENPKHQKTSTNHSHPREEDEHPRAGRSPRPPRDKHRSDTTTKRNRDSPGQEEAPEYQTTNTNHDHEKKNTPGRAEAPKRHQDNNNREEKPQRAAIGQKPTAATKRKRISGGVGTSPRAPKDKQHKIEIGMNEHVQYFTIYSIYLPFRSFWQCFRFHGKWPARMPSDIPSDKSSA